jgi:hypothetical protein
MDDVRILCETRDRIVTLRINRPDEHSAGAQAFADDNLEPQWSNSRL